MFFFFGQYFLFFCAYNFYGFFFVVVLLIYLNWRLITILWFLPYIDMSQPGGTCVPHPEPPSHPSGLSYCTGFECPVSYVKRGLVICFTYGNTHVSMLFSQIIPSHRVPKPVLFICVSFVVSHIGSSLPSFSIPYICVNILF